MMNNLFRKKSVARIVADAQQGTGLAKVLGVRDLVSLGIAAIVGAGIFSTIGLASYEVGPAIDLLFEFVAFACVFTALAYANLRVRFRYLVVLIPTRMSPLGSFLPGLLVGLWF